MTDTHENPQITRITAFSDGVIAIAITLLTLEIGIPELTRAEIANHFGQVLLDILPNIAGYLQAFLVVGIYWTVHHRFFGYIKRYDQGLLWVNLLFLLTIAFLPIPSTFMIHYFTEPVVMVFYLVCIILTGMANTLLWWYVSAHHRLVDATLSPDFIRYTLVRSLIPPASALIGILLYFVWPYAVYSFSYIIILGFILLPRVYQAPRDYLTPPTEPT